MSLNINRNFGAISGGALTALNAHQSQMGKSITRVSTGMRVNSAADDASAYLASRRIKSDSDGYTALYNGLQTGSAKLNAADSAVSSVLDVLNAMKAKALEYKATSDAEAQNSIASEYNTLNRVLESSLNFQYNGEEILNSKQNLSFYTTAYDDVTGVSLDYSSDIKLGGGGYILNGSDNIGSYSDTKSGQFTYGGIKYVVNLEEGGKVTEAADSTTVVGYMSDAGIAWAGDYRQSKMGGQYFEIGSDDMKLTADFGGYRKDTVMGKDKSKLAINGIEITLNDGVKTDKASGGSVTASGQTIGSWYIDDHKKYQINLDGGVGAIGVGWNNIKEKIDNASIKNIANADIVDNLKKAITQVSAEQTKITTGMVAMDHASSFLQNSANTQDAAYQNITEADMAKEMTNYVKNNVFAQAAQAMIAQANQSMAQVLNLLQ